MLAQLLESLKTKRETQAVSAAESYRRLVVATAKGKAVDVDHAEATLNAAGKAAEVFAIDVAAVERMNALQKECLVPYTVEQWRADAKQIQADEKAAEDTLEAARLARRLAFDEHSAKSAAIQQKRDRYEAAQRELVELQSVWGDK